MDPEPEYLQEVLEEKEKRPLARRMVGIPGRTGLWRAGAADIPQRVLHLYI